MVANTRGNGLLVPVAKAMAHLHIIHAALTREWPMTLAAARAELTEATAHLGDLVLPEGWISQATLDAIGEWSSNLTNLDTVLVGNDDTPLAEAENLNAATLQDNIVGAWNIYNALDRELVGYSGAQASAGTTP